MRRMFLWVGHWCAHDGLHQCLLGLLQCTSCDINTLALWPTLPVPLKDAPGTLCSAGTDRHAVSTRVDGGCQFFQWVRQPILTNKAAPFPT